MLDGHSGGDWPTEAGFLEREIFSSGFKRIMSSSLAWALLEQSYKSIGSKGAGESELPFEWSAFSEHKFSIFKTFSNLYLEIIGCSTCMSHFNWKVGPAKSVSPSQWSRSDGLLFVSMQSRDASNKSGEHGNCGEIERDKKRPSCQDWPHGPTVLAITEKSDRKSVSVLLSNRSRPE